MEILGIDVGGSGIKGGIVNIESGSLITERHRIPTPQPATPKAVARTVARLTKHFDWKGPIGAGFPAAILDGIVKTAANIDSKWIGNPVEATFAQTTGCRVKVVNDADAAGLAEAYFGGGKEQKGLVVLLTLGTGIGSAFILDGVLVPNTEFGHLRFKGGIAEHYAADAVRKRQDLSWKEWGKRLNEYLHHVYRICYPNLIILGGGASKKFDKFSSFLDVPTLVKPAELLNQAGIVGAALAAKHLIHD